MRSLSPIDRSDWWLSEAEVLIMSDIYGIWLHAVAWFIDSWWDRDVRCSMPWLSYISDWAGSSPSESNIRVQVPSDWECRVIGRCLVIESGEWLGGADCWVWLNTPRVWTYELSLWCITFDMCTGHGGTKMHFLMLYGIVMFMTFHTHWHVGIEMYFPHAIW